MARVDHPYDITLKRWEVRIWIFRIRINELTPTHVRDPRYVAHEQKAFQSANPESPSRNPQTSEKGDSHEKE